MTHIQRTQQNPPRRINKLQCHVFIDENYKIALLYLAGLNYYSFMLKINPDDMEKYERLRTYVSNDIRTGNLTYCLVELTFMNGNSESILKQKR